MAKAKKSSLNKPMTFRSWHVLVFIAVFGAVGVYAVWGALAAPYRGPSGSCSYANQVVSAKGLPTTEVINFLITNNSTGTRSGWVLGYSDGTWDVNVPAPSGPTTYDFVSKTWGPNGSKFRIFAECSTSG